MGAEITSDIIECSKCCDIAFRSMTHAERASSRGIASGPKTASDVFSCDAYVFKQENKHVAIAFTHCKSSK
jgi:hypothetical protein